MLKFMGDFETTVFKGQTFTCVWASGIVPIRNNIDTKDCIIHNNIDDTFDFLFKLKKDATVFYHNLKFDGTFIIDWLHKNGWKFADNIKDTSKRKKAKELYAKEYTCFISDRGQWYTIAMKTPQQKIITFADSLKLLPFSVAEIAKSFKTKYQKGVIKYEGVRLPGQEISPDEIEYLKKDLLIPAEALNILFNEGFKKSTIGSCALDYFRKNCLRDRMLFNDYFPNMENLKSPVKNRNLDEYVRNAYKGGWCYVVKGKENKIFKNGCTADVNSLYPSVMQDEKNVYPVGRPKLFYNKIPERVINNPNLYYFVRIKCKFDLKPGFLPFIQIKGSPYYKSTENLITSDLFYNGKYYDSYVNEKGKVEPVRVILTLTKTDFILFKEHYNLTDLQILDGVYYHTRTGKQIFGKYIEHWAKVKISSEGARRTIAKLMLNNLYGKFSTNKISNWKKPYFDGHLKFENIFDDSKKLIQVSVGAAVTSYARDFTIRAAQKNFYGVNNPGFIYADTDSIHCDLPPESLQGVTIHDKNFSCWKIENTWQNAIFVRQKTYIEEENENYIVKCAGMNAKCKDLLRLSLRDKSIDIYSFIEKYENINEEQKDFVKEKRTLKDFKSGLSIYGKLLPEIIDGGTVLHETYFTLK